jgi:hypothetical protein
MNSPLNVIPGNTGLSLCGVSQNGTHRLKPAFLKSQKFNDVTTSVFYHLRKNFGMPQKSPNVFYHLQTASPVTTCVSYHLTKKGGWGVPYPSYKSFGPVLEGSPTSKPFNFNHIIQFCVGPPYLSPLGSYGCRNRGWGCPPELGAEGEDTRVLSKWKRRGSVVCLPMVLIGVARASRPAWECPGEWG